MMVHRQERRGQIQYLKEGFILHWDEDVLTVEVIDYHATVLRLAWKDVQALAKIASGGPDPKASPIRAKRPPPHEV
jgi:hypothetical protein